MKNFKENFKTLTKTALAISVLVALSACPKNNNGNPINPLINAYASCTNCNTMIANGQEFLATESAEYNSAFTLRLGLSGAASTTPYTYNVSQYQGAVAASRGDLSLQRNLYQGYCLIPPGNYSIGTLSVGQYGSGIIQGLKLVATGPAVLVINLNVAQISSQNNRDQYGNLLPVQRLFSTQTVIESVNGQLCNLPVILQ